MEYDKDRSKVIHELLDKVSQNQNDDLNVHVTKRELPKRAHRMPKSKPTNFDTMQGSRITIERAAICSGSPPSPDKPLSRFGKWLFNPHMQKEQPNC